MSAFFNQYRGTLLLLLVSMVTIALFIHGPIPQIKGYNDFANQCSWFGLQNAENVLTNLPFLIFGMWGLTRIRHFVIESKIERFAWVGFFIGVSLTTFGSTYYHLDPDNYRLVWDRLPITFSFICLFSAVLAERISTKLAAISFIPMVVYSIAAVIYWYVTETSGAGDMRPYILVQLLPLMLIPLLMILYTPRYSHGWMLLMVAVWYLLAKVFEGFDGIVYQWNGYISGHGIKHLLAAMACAQVIWMLEKRKVISSRKSSLFNNQISR
ncbi:MAG: hypothetical protein AB7I18_02875 [Candidatus Berkiella sp.]